MKKVRVRFIDYYGTPLEHILSYRILRRLYAVEICEDPDYVIDGGLGSEHLAYPDAVKIVFVGESYVPDFNQFDYAVGFDPLTFGDRYLRLPLFALYGEFMNWARRPPVTPDLAKRGFCSFVVSNDDGDPARCEFFRKLSKYKPVASGGKLFNNVGGRVPDKLAFLAKYKFNIAFENSCVPGYTTEKVMQPLTVRSLPVYYGNPLVADDFDPACMVRVASRDDMDRAIEEIVALDRDDDAYLARLSAPSAVHPFSWHEERLTAFLRHVFDQPLESARRLNDYGYQTNLRRRSLQADRIYLWTHPGKLLKRLRSHAV